jgi:hypothetical protein
MQAHGGDLPSALMIIGKLVQKGFLIVGQVGRRGGHCLDKKYFQGSQALLARSDRRCMSPNASKPT